MLGFVSLLMDMSAELVHCLLQMFLVSTLGMGIGSFAGGVLYDRLGSYAWLYMGSFVIGAAAIVLALTFRAPRSLGALTPVA